VKEVFERAGATVMGRRMFDEGEIGWPENRLLRAPVFVVTRSAPEPWQRMGGTTFFFVTEGVASALEQAMAAAGGNDVRVSGGAETIRQFVESGLIDAITLHMAPVLLGTGVRVLDHPVPTDFELQQVGVSSSARVTYIKYQVVRSAPKRDTE
jgi:dihydrofolate reductase